MIQPRPSTCVIVALAVLAGASPTRQAVATGVETDALRGDDVRELACEFEGDQAHVHLELAPTLLKSGRFDEVWLEQLVRQTYARFDAEGRAVSAVHLLARSPRALPKRGVSAGDEVLLHELLPDVQPVPTRPEEPPPLAAPMPPSPDVRGAAWTGVATGSLAGRTIYVSPGHGFTWTQALNRWATQRGNTHSLVEDLIHAEAVAHYLAPILTNAGARVVTVRERDMQTAMVIVDDGDGGGSEAGGAGYHEVGSFQAGTDAGFANGKAPYEGSTNPFVLGGYRAAKAVAGEPTASASFVPDVEVAGVYAVYAGWVAGANRVSDAHFEVRHAAGSAHRRFNMQRHGRTWNYLGHFYFDVGADPLHGAVVLHNDTLEAADGKYVIADVVRFGGGLGDIVRGTGAPPSAGPTSTRPRFEESARYYAQFAGAPPAVWDTSTSDPSDDVSTRSRFAAWDHEDGEDALFVSWHSNAPDPGRGTSTYVYGPNAPDGSYQFTGTKGSDAFAKILQKTVVDDVRALFDENWKDRGVRSAWFGEVNPKHNPEMPSALIECAFHSTKADADFLREPRFRHALARAIYKAIVRYFAERDGVEAQLLPEPVRAVAVEVIDPTTARVSWQPGAAGGVWGDPATSYRVQSSKDGRAFDDGIETDATSLEVPMQGPGVPLFVRVIAVNAGGVSLPTAVLGAVASCGDARRALIVQGFTRLAASQAPMDDLSPWKLGDIQRLRQRRMNTFDYAIEHVGALAAADVAIDSADRQGLSGVNAATYAIVDWAAGEQSTIDGVWTAAERTWLAAWLDGGGSRLLLASGAEIAWAVDHKGDAASADWLATWFGARYADDDAGVYDFAGSAAATASLGQHWFDDGSHGGYDVDYPDVLQLEGATALLDYGGDGGVAASLLASGSARSILVGFPLESVWPASARADVVAALLAAAEVAPGSFDCPAQIADGDSADGGALDSDSGSGSDTAGSGQTGGDQTGGDLTGGDLAGGDLAASDLTGNAARPPDPGCGCQSAAPAHPPGPAAGYFVLFLMSCLFAHRRMRRSARSGRHGVRH